LFVTSLTEVKARSATRQDGARRRGRAVSNEEYRREFLRSSH